ncbi:MAG TPA: RES family NAD+ phosphorylase [Chitinophagaceae bacterium]|nr:RES family NAD+ phosphorylase [Chitinophagaceae bacterium]
MIVYRIGKTKYAYDLTGEGARLNGGRWNHKLTPCVYTSESRALALLEYTANVNIDDIPRALSFTTIEISLDNILEVKIENLPGNWTASPAPGSTRDFGTTLFKKGDFAVIKIPSAIIPLEYNYLLNPLHSDITKCKILAVHDFVYDVRLKK